MNLNDGLVHIGKTWHGLHAYMQIRCCPFDYLKWDDYDKRDDFATCLACIGGHARLDEVLVSRVGGP